MKKEVIQAQFVYSKKPDKVEIKDLYRSQVPEKKAIIRVM